MAVESIQRETVALKLVSGTTPAGGVKTVTSAIAGTVASADSDKIMAIVAALLPCLEYPLHRVLRTTVTTIEN